MAVSVKTIGLAPRLNRAASRSVVTAASPPSRLLVGSHALLRPGTRLGSSAVRARAAVFSTTTAAARQAQQQQQIKVDKDRLLNDIHHTCQWGPGERWGDAATETGMSRLALSEADKNVRDWFAETTKALGCTVTVDEMGNQFAVRPGRKEGAPTYAGSHLDTQPTGGRYDGILGVVAAVEMLRVLDDHALETAYPVGVVNWTNEEGARFPISMLSSGVWSGNIPLPRAHSLASIVPADNQLTVRAALERIGYLGSTPCSHAATPMAAHFELHIEQGPLLEKAGRRVGIVEGVQAYRWFTVSVAGRDAHTGTTDLASRADALLAAAKMVVAAREAAWQEGGLASVGVIEARPGSTNTVPGSVRFSLDIRAARDGTLRAIERRLRDTFAFIASGRSSRDLADPRAEPPNDIVKVEWRLDSDSPATRFHKDCVECVRGACEDVFPGGAAGGKAWEALTMRMTSGAGHDSVYASKRVPTSMIFVPCRDGVSHNPTEYSTPEDCALGAQVLMNAVLRYDGLRAERGGVEGRIE